MTTLNIIPVLGPPGCGKGTYGKRSNLLHISTGDQLRSEIKQKTPFGLEAQSFIDKGEFIPNDKMNAYILDLFLQHVGERGIYSDGFPRTVLQGELLESWESEGLFVPGAIYLEVPHEVTIERIKGRAIIDTAKGNPRPDDLNEDIIRKRLNIYDAKTKPVIEFYEMKNLLYVLKDPCVSPEEGIPLMSGKVNEAVDSILS